MDNLKSIENSTIGVSVRKFRPKKIYLLKVMYKKRMMENTKKMDTLMFNF